MDIRTVEDKEKLLEYLELVKQNIFRGKDIKIPGQYSDMINSELKKRKLDLKDKNSLTAGINNIENELNEMKELDLAIAFEPSQRFINEVFSWIKKNLGVNVIINFKIDPEIVAGAIISFNGRYSDLSLKSKLDNAFVNKKREILKTINI